MADKFQAKLRKYRVSPRKVRLVVDLVRGRTVADALDILKLTNKASAPAMAKLIESAMENAQQKATVDVDRLVVSEAFVDEGPTYKRFIPRAQGRATPIRKRTSHVTVRVSEL